MGTCKNQALIVNEYVSNDHKVVRCRRKCSANCQQSTTSSRRLIQAANAFVFALNKVTLKMKHGFHHRRLNHQRQQQGELTNDSKIHLDNLSELYCNLSSIAVGPSFVGCMSSERGSTPSLLTRFLPTDTKKLLDLSDGILVKISSYLDGKSVQQLSQTCHRMRTVLADSKQHMEKQVITSYEIVVSFNMDSQKVDVRAMKRNRSIRDPIIQGSSIDDVIPAHVCCMGRVTFGVGVNVMDWKSALLRLSAENRLRPLSLVFTGGVFTSGNYLCGADLRGFSESGFIRFIDNFQPHLQEVQLATTRLFKCSISPPMIVNYMLSLSSFGVVYERPALRYDFDDIRRIVENWRHDPLSRSCSMYIRRPSGGTCKNWEAVGAVCDFLDSKISRATIEHLFQTNVCLTFNFH